jgi:hypothetical protein
MKNCNECSLCCKLLDVPGIAAAGEWCPHCTPGNKSGGCTIHSKRPEICLGFNCFWRAESWPDELRPDRCKVIFEALPGVETILITIDPSQPDAWKKKEIIEVMMKLVKKGRPIVFKATNYSQMLLPKGWTRHMVLHDIQTVLDWKEKNK